RVVRRLAARVAGGGHVRVGRVDGLARRDPEADDDAAPARRPVRPPGVVRLRERRAVEVEAEAVREVDVDVVRPALGSPDRRVRDGDAEATVERDGRVDVARDEVEKVQHGRRRRHRFFPRIREALDAQRSGCQHATSRFASRTPVARPVRAGVNMSEPLTPAKIIELGRGFMGSKALLAAGKLRLFDALRDGPLTAAEIRKRLELHPRAVPDFVDALVALGMLAREGDGPNARYANTPEGARFLVTTSEHYVGGALDMFNDRLFRFWADLDEALKTGAPQNEIKRTGAPMFEELYRDPERLAQFMAAMSGISRPNFQALAEKFDFSRYQTLCDVGGAAADLSCAVASRHPHLRCTSFDLPVVEPIARAAIARRRLSDRVTTAAGDFFKDPIPKADVVTMGMILHDWNLEKKKHLIRAVHAALPAG